MQPSTRLTLAALLLLAFAPCLATAQGDKTTKPESETPATQAEPKPQKPEPLPYLLAISVKESNSGKPVLEKNYALTVIADDRHSLRLRDSDRIPYQSEKGQQYEDVGTNIDLNGATRRGEALVADLQLTSSVLVATPNYNAGNLPQISQWSVNIVAVLLPNKPTIVYSATDGVSGHKVEIQATAQPLNAQ